MRRIPDRAVRRVLHDLDAALAVDTLFVAFAAYRDRLSVRRLIRPTPFASIVLVHPVRGISTVSHLWPPLQLEASGLTHGRK